jgi:hypothetical protein
MTSKMRLKPASRSAGGSSPNKEDSYTAMISRRTWAWSRMGMGGFNDGSSRSCNKELGPQEIRVAKGCCYQSHTKKCTSLSFYSIEEDFKSHVSDSISGVQYVSIVIDTKDSAYSINVLDRSASSPIVRRIVTI